MLTVFRLSSLIDRMTNECGAVGMKIGRSWDFAWSALMGS